MNNTAVSKPIVIMRKTGTLTPVFMPVGNAPLRILVTESVTSPSREKVFVETVSSSAVPNLKEEV